MITYEVHYWKSGAPTVREFTRLRDAIKLQKRLRRGRDLTAEVFRSHYGELDKVLANGKLKP